MVVRRWTARGTHEGELMGTAPSGNAIEVSGMSMDRISGGKIVEDWVNWDALEMLQQIGALSQSGPTQEV